ncbi:putative signal transducing protein [Caulobacter sp. UNC279MFTsu5.1]|uniref:putative signal transducing protein n=1 Tax=Caulobacter sp. UNC279MFTsu5.1 TaxID=1502775 RepID=UPI0008EB32B5|nr:DUF2007 domain-containing protein [Caulobacter sp. UNC279MFTsu5.1]SFJ52364.1 Putative signal transducing protein [Caulobacter sp. UNC279MFTsu5.1]
MSLKEIARFADLAEAQIAASRLRAEGVQVLVQNEYWGGADFIMTIAMGGFRLWAPESEAAEAKALIGELRAAAPPPLDLDDDEEPVPPPSRPAPLAGLARTGLALLLTLVFGWAAGFLVIDRRRPAAVTGVMVVLAVISGLSLLAMIWTWLTYAGIGATPAWP